MSIRLIDLAAEAGYIDLADRLEKIRDRDCRLIVNVPAQIGSVFDGGIGLEAWADQVAGSYNVLPMDAACFRRWAKLMHGQSDTVYEDAMLAATALTHNLTVVTRNLREFARFNVPLLNPFK